MKQYPVASDKGRKSRNPVDTLAKGVPAVQDTMSNAQSCPIIYALRHNSFSIQDTGKFKIASIPHASNERPII